MFEDRGQEAELRVSIEFRTIADLTSLVRDQVNHLPRDIDLVVGVPRSGLLAATMVALLRNLPLATPETLASGEFLSGGQSRGMNGAPAIDRVRSPLVVDDSVHTGSAMAAAKTASKRQLGVEPKTMAAYVAPEAMGAVDIALEACPMPRMFEWNWMHHADLSCCCVDIDGVLCKDPEPFQNDDGVEYRRFLLDAEPKYLPSRPVGWLVTSRLGCYREETEKWLECNNVSYESLHMSPHATMAERQQAGDHAFQKARVYKTTPSRLFIESEQGQAEVIAQIAAKPVFCPTNGCVYKPHGVASLRQELRESNHRLLNLIHRVRAGIGRRLFSS